VGYPDPDTFHDTFGKLAEFHDELWRRTGLTPDQTVLGGFSMGSVMSYALGLAGERPAPAGVLAFSGFVPTVDGWEPHLADRTTTRVFIAHGRGDPIMAVDFGRRARDLLEEGGLDVTYRESDVGHTIDPAYLPVAAAWLSSALPSPGASPD
jgi:phospholipase/carboxylesterase